MISLVKYISTAIKNMRRTVTVNNANGTYDPRTGYQCGPYGIDSQPVEGWQAIYLTTENSNTQAVIGYIDKKALAEAGGTRIFSEGIAIYLRANGTIELGGTVDNAVRYNPLNTGLQNLATGINNNLSAISAAINAIVPGAYIPVPVSVNITASKINEIQTP